MILRDIVLGFADDDFENRAILPFEPTAVAEVMIAFSRRRKIYNAEIAKVIVNAMEGDFAPFISCIMLNVCIVHVPVKMEILRSLPPCSIERMRWFADLLFTGLSTFAARHGIDHALILEMRNECERAQYRHQGKLASRFWSPSRMKLAKVRYEYVCNRLNAFVDVEFKQSGRKETFNAGTIHRAQGGMHSYFKTAKWLTEEEFEVCSGDRVVPQLKIILGNSETGR